jgi:hypothetical protein
MQKSHKEVSHDKRVFSEQREALALLPDAARVIIRDLETRVLWLLAVLVLLIFLNGLTLYLVEVESDFLDPLFGVLGSLVASGIIAMLALGVAFFRRTK